MLKNPFKKESAQLAAPSTASKHTRVPPASADARHASVQAAAAIPAEEMQNWRDKILAAKSDDAALLRLAHQVPGVELKLAAIQALTHEDSFKQAMREFRDQDKRLHRAARSRWQAASNKRTTVAEAQALLDGARTLLEQESVPANRVVELDRAWAALDSGLLAAELTEQFAALREQLASKVRARGEGEQAIVRWLAAVDNAIAQLIPSLAAVAQGDTPGSGSAALAASLLELLGSVPDAIDARCAEKTDVANRALALASSVVQRAEFLQSLPVAGAADEASEKLKIEQWRGFPEVSETQLQATLARRFADWRNAGNDERHREHEARRVHEQELGDEQKQQRISAIQRDLDAAEAAHAAGNTAELTHLLAAIDKALKTGTVSASLTRRIEALRQEQKRLRDWQRWSGKQGREQLVVEAQTLAASAAGKIAVKTHAEAIDTLRERWKELDKLGGATNQTLWLAFDGALKTAYAPVAAHLDKLKAARAENLLARERIVDTLAQTAAKLLPAASEAHAAPGAAPDLRAIGRALEDAQTAWRKLGPVEHTVPRKAQKGDQGITSRYAQAIQTLEAPLNAAYREATQHREQLIAAAKDLAATAPTARDVLDKVKSLQSRWQAHAKATTLPRREENKLWTEFKTATDAIFAARDAARTAQESAANEKIKERLEIIERLSALPDASTVSDIKRAMGDAETAWRAAPAAPKPQIAKLDARYRAARESATRRLGELAARAAQARYVALLAGITLCEEREAATDSGAELTAQQATDLETRWNAIENFPDTWRAALEARFRGHGVAESSSKSGSKSSESLPDMLLNLEVASGIDSPPEFLAARQALKLRALKNAMEARQTAVTTPADIERWLLAAAATPRVDATSRARLAKIIAAVRTRR